MGKVKELVEKLKKAFDNMLNSNELNNEDLKQKEGESFEAWAARLTAEQEKCESIIKGCEISEKAVPMNSTPDNMSVDLMNIQYKRAVQEDRKVLIGKILEEINKAKSSEAQMGE